MDAIYWHICYQKNHLKTSQVSVCWNKKLVKFLKLRQKKLYTNISMLKQKKTSQISANCDRQKKLDSFKTWSCRPNSRMIGSVPFGRVRLHLRCLALTACRILILSKEMAEPRIPSKPWRRFRSMKTIFFLIQTFCSLFFWNACKFS